MAYDESNVFAKILKGDLPCTKVYEDDAVLSFMDLFPQSKGHTLVIPKEPAENIFDLSQGGLSGLILRTQKIATAIKAALEPDGITLLQFNGAAAGQTVFHIHFHLIPRWEGQAMKGHGQAEKADPAELQTIADRIAAKL